MRTDHIEDLNATLDERLRETRTEIARREAALTPWRSLFEEAQGAERAMRAELARATALREKAGEAVEAREWEIEQLRGFAEACEAFAAGAAREAGPRADPARLVAQGPAVSLRPPAHPRLNGGHAHDPA